MNGIQQPRTAGEALDDCRAYSNLEAGQLNAAANLGESIIKLLGDTWGAKAVTAGTGATENRTPAYVAIGLIVLTLLFTALYFTLKK